MIKFNKIENGNVQIIDSDDNIIGSFSLAMNVFKHPSKDGVLFISDDASPRETSKGYNISFDSVDLSGSSPAIVANNMNELIASLSNNFFFVS